MIHIMMLELPYRDVLEPLVNLAMEEEVRIYLVGGSVRDIILGKEIEDLDRTKQNLLARMNVIQELQSSRPQIVHLFDEMVSMLPDGVYLTSVNQKGSNLTFEGKAQSNARVSSLMRNIDDSEWLSNPKLDVIESKEKTGTGYSHFKLTASQIVQVGEDEK